ncbi:hypothetical protein [Scytonema sp. PCC 10023]|uniref:hypothetical protein n=1 Tax=Scytonema sp. PCC 10023 TaxID=1680591 RepID=UPI0039C5B6DD
MVKSVLVRVDNDPLVLQTVERNLCHQYGSRLRVLEATAVLALGTLQQVKLCNEPINL